MTLRLDSTHKVSRTDTHLFFLTGPFSQWDASAFTAALPAIPGHCAPSAEMTFNCAEQFMMAGKAHLFGDHAALEAIMAVQPTPGRPFRDIPDAQKKLGRTVQSFDPKVWDAHDTTIVLEGNRAKFAQSPRHRAALLESEGLILVEGAHYDPIWGVGLAWNDPRIADPANWKGQNKLGKVLMQVRSELA